MELLTIEALELLERVSNAAPRKRGSYVHAAQIPWALIEELRAFLARIEPA